MDIVDRMVGIDQVVGLSPDGNEAILGRTSEKKFAKVFERAADLGID